MSELLRNNVRDPRSQDPDFQELWTTRRLPVDQNSFYNLLCYNIIILYKTECFREKLGLGLRTRELRLEDSDLRTPT